MATEVHGQNKTHMGIFEGTCFKHRTMAGKWTLRRCATVAAWTRRCFKVTRLRQPLLLLMLVIISLLVPCYASQPPDVVHYDKPGTEKDMHFLFHGNESKNSTHDRANYPKVNWHEEGHGGIHVAAWNFQHVKAPLVIVMFTTVAALCKLGFHHANFLSSIVPESCLLIVLGTVLGGILTGAGADFFPTSLPPDVFFLYLLPPIILESAYSLHDRTFFDNVGTVMFYAVIGTVINCFLIGPTLYGLMAVGAMGDDFSVTFVQCLLFSALIVAVDPVAVLAIFQEIGVNQTLYFLVFGESLFNDAVTVVLYNTMKAFNAMPPEDIDAGQVFLAVAAFFVVSLGGAVLGILFGALSSVITKYTEHVRVVEPLTILLLAYLSYLSAELFHFSGIIGICCCGLMQAHYAFNNISHKSLTTVTYFSKMLSTASDCMIFMFLGLTLVRPDHDWHTGFTLWTLFLCLVIRFMSVFGLTLIANKLYRLRKIELEEQFIMAYGGLRGAVCFSLVAMLNEKDVPRFRAFLTTSLVVIIFTVFIQGGTIKPLTKLLQIKKKKNKVVSMSEEINYHVTDHVLAGIEEIMGTHGDHWLRESVNRLDLQYLKKWLQNNPQRHDEQIMELFQEIALRQHYENVAGTDAARRWASSIDIAPEFEGDEPPKSPPPEALKDLLHEYMHVTTAIMHRTTDMEKSDREKLAQRIRSGSGGSLDFNHELHVPTVPRPSLPFLAVRSATIASNASDDYEDMLENAAMLEHPDLLRNAPDTAFPGSPRRRLSTSAAAKFIPNPKPSDLRKMLVKAPSRALHAKADKNLVREDSQDLVHQLHEKQLRQNRYRRAMSVSFSPSGSPLLPRSVKGAARQAAFTAKLRRQHSEPSPEKEVVDGVHDERKRVTLPPETHHMEAIEESEESETEDTKGEKPKGNGEAKVPYSEADREADVRAERAKTRRVQKAYSLGDTPKDSAMFDLGRGESEEAEDTFPEETEMVELPKKDASETDPMLTKSATDTALIKRGQETKVDIEDSSSETDNGKMKPMAEKRRKMRKLQRKGAMDDPKV